MTLLPNRCAGDLEGRRLGWTRPGGDAGRGGRQGYVAITAGKEGGDGEGAGAVGWFRMKASTSMPQVHGASWPDNGAAGGRGDEGGLPVPAGRWDGRLLKGTSVVGRWPSGGTVVSGEGWPSPFRPCSPPPSRPEA